MTGNSYIQLLYARLFVVVQIFNFVNFQYNLKVFRCWILVHSEISRPFSRIHVDLGVLIRKGDNITKYKRLSGHMKNDMDWRPFYHIKHSTALQAPLTHPNNHP